METVMTALSTAMSTVGTNVTDAIGTAAPIALGAAGIIIVVRVGWKVFRGFIK